MKAFLTGFEKQSSRKLLKRVANRLIKIKDDNDELVDKFNDIMIDKAGDALRKEHKEKR